MLKKWKKKESKDAKDFKGSRQKASGSVWNSPSDSTTAIFSIDSKSTEKGSYSISLATWNKLCEEAAWNQERIPLLSIEIRGLELCVLAKEDLLRIIKED